MCGRYILDTRMTAWMGGMCVSWVREFVGEIGRGRYLVDITQDDVLHSVVLEDFTHDATVTTSNDQYPLRVWMARQWEMGDHLLVPACILVDHAVKRKRKKRELTKTHRAQCTG